MCAQCVCQATGSQASARGRECETRRDEDMSRCMSNEQGTDTKCAKFAGRPEDGAAYPCTHPPYTAAKLCGKLLQSAILLCCQRNHAMPRSDQGAIWGGGSCQTCSRMFFIFVFSFLSEVQKYTSRTTSERGPRELASLPTCQTKP